MRCPTVKTMVKMGFKEDEAKKIRKIMEDWNMLTHVSKPLEKIRQIMNAEKIDYIILNDQAIHFVHNGDPYDTTIIFNGSWQVGNIGYYMER